MKKNIRFLLALIFFYINIVFIYSQRNIPTLSNNLEDIVYGKVSSILKNNHYELPDNYSYEVVNGIRIGSNQIIRLRLHYKKIEILRSDMVLIYNRNSEKFTYEKYNIIKVPNTLITSPAINLETAVNLIKNDFVNNNCQISLNKKQKLFYIKNNEIVLSYYLSFNSDECLVDYNYIVDASSGVILSKNANQITNTPNNANIKANQSNKCINQFVNTKINRSQCSPTAGIFQPDPTEMKRDTVEVDAFEKYGITCLGKYVFKTTPNKPDSLFVDSYAYYADKLKTSIISFIENEFLNCNPESGDFTFPIDSPQYRVVVAYKHLNKYFDYLYNEIGVSKSLESDTIGLAPVHFNANLKVSQPFVGYVSSRNEILFSYQDIKYYNGAKVNYEPLASDLFWIYAAGIDYVLDVINSNISNNEGIFGGVLDYFAQSYKWQVTGNSDPSCFNYGGMISPNDTPENDGVLIWKRFTDALNCEDQKRSYLKVQLLSSFLMQIHKEFSPKQSDKLVLLTCSVIDEEINSQVKFAKELFKIANNSSNDLGFTCDDLKKLENIILNFYGPCDEMLSLENKSNLVDYWIKDSVDDIGEEPNLKTGAVIWESPDIWNTDNPSGINFSIPKYGESNYIRVRVRNRGSCINENSKLRVYWAKTATSLNWPSDWTNNLPYGNEITTDSGVTLGDIKPNGDSIYTINWTDRVPNPNDLEEENLHISIYARITESSDSSSEHSSVHNINNDTESKGLFSTIENTRNFNGIAWKTINLIDENTVPNYTNDSIINLGKVWIKSDTNSTNTINSVPINIFIKINNGLDENGNPKPDNPNLTIQDSAFFDKVDLFIRPNDDLLEQINLKTNLSKPHSTNWEQIFEDSFGYSDIILEPGKYYYVELGYKAKSNFDNCSFSLIQESNLSREMGGASFMIFNPKPNLNSRINIKSNQVTIFPNPAKSGNTITIISKKYNIKKIELLSTNGKIIKSMRGDFNRVIEFKLNSNIPKGIYWLIIKMEKYTYTEKIIVK